MHASEKGYLGLVVQLLKAGANIELKSMWGETALSIASRQQHSEVVAVLVKHGAK